MVLASVAPREPLGNGDAGGASCTSRTRRVLPRTQSRLPPRVPNERWTRLASVRSADGGTQALEFALVLPAVVLVLTLLFHAAVMGADIVVVHGLAREAARAAAVDGEGAARQAVTEAAGGRRVEVDVDTSGTAGAGRSGGTVTAEVRLNTRAFAAFGADLWVPAHAVMRAEHP